MIYTEDPINTQSYQVYTIGHSTRPISEFIDIIKHYNIQKVIDVRTIPNSKYNPQYNKETLTDSLKKENIGYLHMPGLGGLRSPKADSANKGWKNLSFRGFADFMQKDEFEKNLDILIGQIKLKTSVLMCAEAVPWRCHRSLISDALQIRGINVKHIIGMKICNPHVLTSWAEVENMSLTYPS